MKRNFAIAFLFTLCIANVLSCKKEDDGGCGSYGGIVMPNVYMFWVAQDFGGQVTVEVKDSNGKIVSGINDKIIQTTSQAPECSNTNYYRFASFELYQGQGYTYKARCSGKSWSGTIQVPCEQKQCKNIQLQ